MNQKLFTVENSFKVAGREGIVIAANLPPKLPEFKVGSAVVLIKPDGTEIIAEIGETEMIKTVGGIRKIAVLIKNITKKDVAIETEVFLKKSTAPKNVE